MKYRAILRRMIVLGLPAIIILAQPRVGQGSSYLIDTEPLRIRDQFFLGMGFLAFDTVVALTVTLPGGLSSWRTVSIAEACTSGAPRGFAGFRFSGSSLQLDESRQSARSESWICFACTLAG